MPRNVEIKALVHNRAHVEATARKLATQGPIHLEQDDAFFVVPNGRLKLRVERDARGLTEARLIQYERADTAGPKASSYAMVATPEPDALRDVLTRALGSDGRVRKQRTLYLVGRTRVHLDQVEDLGCYLELEVVLAEGESESAGEAEAQGLVSAFGIRPEHLVEVAYRDLLARRA